VQNPKNLPWKVCFTGLYIAASVESKCSMAAMIISVSVIKGIQIQMFDFAAIPQSLLHHHFQTLSKYSPDQKFQSCLPIPWRNLENHHHPDMEECSFMTKQVPLISLMARSEAH
jgi:hypothetical protein